MKIVLQDRLKRETTETKGVKTAKKALVYAACYDTIVPIAEKAKLIGIELPDIYMGTCVGALINLFVPLQEFNRLDAVIRDYRMYYAQEPDLRTMVRKWVFGDQRNLRSIIERHYTKACHLELIGSKAVVKIGLANINTATVEYLDMRQLSYQEAVGVTIASIQQPYLPPIEINNNFYVEANLLDRNHALHVMDMGAAEIDLLVPRNREQAADHAWRPSSNAGALEQVFKAIRNYKPEFQDYTVTTISNARQITTRLHYLEDAVDAR